MSTRVSRSLREGWRVVRSGGSVAAPVDLPEDGLEAEVPGCVHLDLIRHGLLIDPDQGDGETAQLWVGRTDWTWRRVMSELDLPANLDSHAVVELVFDALDTVGEVRLDGALLGEVQNQFHPHRYRVEAATIRRGCVLEVELRAPLDELDRLVDRLGNRPVNADGDWGVYSYLRKASCSFGWDWGPKCPSSGILGEARIEVWTAARIEHVRPLVRTCNDRLAVVEIAVDVAMESDADVQEFVALVRVAAPDGRGFEESVPVRSTEAGGLATATIEIPEPARWWPRGFGEQPLHEVSVTLRRHEEDLDVAIRKIGLRIVALDTGKDPEGARFRFVVNGEPIFCRGANWIPDGLFPGTSEPSRIRTRIGQAVSTNFNMLRVWGGGIYEQAAFYETCDELGVLVWQDFMFACATYPEDDPFPASIEREARHQVARLASHPSIVLWCGGNENVLAWRNWGWRERMDPAQAWGKTYFTDLLPGICADLDPSRPYLVDSPWSGDVETDPNDPDRGDRHTWDLKVEEVREMVPRFVSEFGHQAPPLRRTIEEALGDEIFSSEKPEALVAFAGRQRGWGGDATQYDRWLDDWFSPATSLDQRLFQMHLLQARATTISYEWLRMNSPRCSGALIWQLNDAWTGHSWSLIDRAGRPKPAWWAARAACASRLIGFTASDEGIAIGIVNDGQSAWSADAIVRRVDVSGRDLAVDHVRLDAAVGKTSQVLVGREIAIPADPSSEFLVVESGTHRAFWFYGKDAWLSLPAAAYDLEFEASAGVCRVGVHARTIVRDLVMDPSRLSPDGVVDRNLLTLLPGDRTCFEFRASAPIDPARFRDSGVFLEANSRASE
ncbi:MAG: hypothetical protein OSA40_03170 [Phycisphaerales bacterium]|nr:hypothetical protein [Phycisphaerales bacterium]